MVTRAAGRARPQGCRGPAHAGRCGWRVLGVRPRRFVAGPRRTSGPIVGRARDATWLACIPSRPSGGRPQGARSLGGGGRGTRGARLDPGAERRARAGVARYRPLPQLAAGARSGSGRAPEVAGRGEAGSRGGDPDRSVARERVQHAEPPVLSDRGRAPRGADGAQGVRRRCLSRLLAQIDSLTPAPRKALEHHRAETIVGVALARAGLADSARHVLLRARADRDVDATQEILSIEAFARTILGDRDQAIALLQRYIAANPTHAFTRGGDISWWWR